MLLHRGAHSADGVARNDREKTKRCVQAEETAGERNAACSIHIGLSEIEPCLSVSHFREKTGRCLRKGRGIYYLVW